MACMGSMSLVIDHNAVEKSILLNNHLPLFAHNQRPLFAHNQRNGNVPRLRSRIKATRENRYGIDTNDALQVTSNKTTTNVAMQTDLQVLFRSLLLLLL